MAKPYIASNEVESTIAAGNTWTRGTDTSIVLTSGANFDAGGGYIRIGDADSFALMEYTGKTSNTLTGLTVCTLGVVVSSGDETKEWPAGTEVARVWVGEDAAGLIMGPASAVDGRVVLFDGTTGKKAKDAGVTLGAGTSGGVPYYSAAGVLGSSAALADNGVVIGGGAGAAPETISAATTTTHALFATAGAPAFRAIAAGDLPSQQVKKYLRGTVASPKDFYDNVDHEICLWPATDAAITITKIQITCDADPTAELDIDLKWADAFIGLGNAAVIDVCDTTAGVVTITSGFDDATVASGKCIYWSLGAAPDAAMTQFSFVIEYTYD
jgi:hypothetical protein